MRNIISKVSKDGFPRIVGRGWGIFIQQWDSQEGLLFMHTYSGPLSDDNMHWKAGTSLREISDALACIGLAFDSHPSLDDVSIGSAQWETTEMEVTPTPDFP